jgi:flagellar basal-body rod protein FlgC
MSIFPILDTANSALHTDRVWMDAVADNIANINTVRPYDQPAFQERFIVATAQRGDGNDPPGVGGGVQPSAVLFGDPKGRIRYEPDNPLANKDGLVRYPDIDLSDQMTQLLMAQRAYQLNLAVVDRARDAYLQALNINGR